jgi:hypothetical protein
MPTLIDYLSERAEETRRHETRRVSLFGSDGEGENGEKQDIDARPMQRREGRKSSSLVSLETIVQSDMGGLQLHRRVKPENRPDIERSVCPSTIEDDIWRHAGWRRDRHRVFAALSAGKSAAVVDRFANCGSQATVEYSPGSCEVRIRASFCRNRWCVPCARARARQEEDRLRGAIVSAESAGKTIRLVTLTQRGYAHESLSTCLNRIRESWRGLRRTDLWMGSVTGGVAVTEVKRGKSGAWHVHYHLIVEGSWIDARALSAAWEEITEDSFRVYVELPRDSEDAVLYAAKYACKPVPPDVYRNPDDLAEAIQALSGRRLFDFFGTWRKAEVVEIERPTDWQRVGTLHQLARLAALGDGEAIAWLRVTAHHAMDDLIACQPPPGQFDATDVDYATGPERCMDGPRNAVLAAMSDASRLFLLDGVVLRLPGVSGRPVGH